MTSEFIFICVNGKGGRKIFLIYVFEKKSQNLKKHCNSKRCAEAIINVKHLHCDEFANCPHAVHILHPKVPD